MPQGFMVTVTMLKVTPHGFRVAPPGFKGCSNPFGLETPIFIFGNPFFKGHSQR